MPIDTSWFPVMAVEAADWLLDLTIGIADAGLEAFVMATLANVFLWMVLT